MTALAIVDDVDEVDAMQERALLRLLVDLVQVGRYNPLSSNVEDALRQIEATATTALRGLP